MLNIATLEQNTAKTILLIQEAIRREKQANPGQEIKINVLDVQLPPATPQVITDPTKLLIHKKESIQEIIARHRKDPWLCPREVAAELKVCPETIIKYCRLGLIEGEHDGYYNSASTGWFVKQSEVNRIKQSPNWLKEFQETAKNKPYLDPAEIRYKKRIEIMQEIDFMRKNNEDLSPGYAYKYRQGLYQRARRYFGGWAELMRVSGIHYSQVYKKWDEPRFMQGRPPLSETERTRRANELLNKIYALHLQDKLNSQARHEIRDQVYFLLGGWKEVYRLLGIKDFDKAGGTKLKIRTKENILEEIRKLHNAGIPLNYTSMYKYYRALLRAAEKKFRGSWSLAIKTAIPDINYSKVKIKKGRQKDRFAYVQRELLCV